MKLRCCMLCCVCLAVCMGGCRLDPQAKTVSSLPDAPLTDSQAKLLDIAFEAASAMPLEPHIKNRSRAQEGVIQACLELDQPQRIRSYVDSIANWRRGLAYAELALYCVRQGVTEGVEAYLTLAQEAAAETEDWRRDRIRVKIAQTYTWLGQQGDAQSFAADVEESESGKVAGIQALLCDESNFEELVATLDGFIATGTYDLVKNALTAYGQLFRRFYDNGDLRDRVEAKITGSWDPVPYFVRIELLADLAEICLEHEDVPKALALVNQAQAIKDGTEWNLEHGLTRQARLIALRYRAGDKDKALADAQQALTQYESERETVVNIYRAKTLRPLAEAFMVMGDEVQARALYRKVLDEGVVNPNSRPRAEDLAATCCSLARYGVEPDVALWQRIREIRDGLGDPW